MVKRPFKGYKFYEWQIGPFVFQLRHTRSSCKMMHEFPLFHVWRDPYTRKAV